MKTHYATVERANENNTNDDWGITLCGLEYTESPLSNNIKDVSCKKCKRAYPMFIEQMNEAIKHF
jgi:hypothetical protein